MVKSRTFFLTLLAIAAGITLRLWFISLTPKGLLYDQGEYVVFRNRFLAGDWAVNCCARTYAYPLFLTAVAKLFGSENFSVIPYIQTVMDATTGILVALISYRVWKDKTVAILTLWLYELNPLTASFVGFILTEVQAFFLLALLTLYVLNLNGRRGKIFILWAVWGLIVGMFVYTRIAFFWWGVVVMALVPLVYFGMKLRTVMTVFSVYAGFVIASVYPVVSNAVYYHKFTPLPPYDIITVSAYTSTKFSYFPTLTDDFYKVVPQEVTDINNEFYRSLTIPGGYEAVRNKYKNMLIETIRKDPKTYILQRLRNMVKVWSKTNIFYYSDPFHPQDAVPVQVLNLAIIATAAAGVVKSLISRSKPAMILLVLAGVLAAFLTVPLSVVAPEERISLPAYPYLMLFSGYGLVFFGVICRRLLSAGRNA